jgi:hypothetical protein
MAKSNSKTRGKVIIAGPTTGKSTLVDRQDTRNIYIDIDDILGPIKKQFNYDLLSNPSEAIKRSVANLTKHICDNLLNHGFNILSNDPYIILSAKPSMMVIRSDVEKHMMERIKNQSSRNQGSSKGSNPKWIKDFAERWRLDYYNNWLEKFKSVSPNAKVVELAEDSGLSDVFESLSGDDPE